MSEKAREIINSLSQEVRIIILKEIINIVLAKGDYLISNNSLKLAIEHLNIFIKVYHYNNLMPELKKLNEKQLHVVNLMTKSSRILKKKLKKKKK